MPDFFKNLKIKPKLFSIAAVCLIGFTLFCLSGYLALNFIKVNGPLYKQIVQGKDTIADVLPPPKYIIEAYLAAFQMLDETSPEGISRLLKDSVRLKREYAERQQFWLKDLPAGELKDELVKFSHQPAEEFFRIRDEEFMPLVLSGQTDKARQLAGSKLKPLYELHRKHIDRVVAIARAMNERDELYGRKIVSQLSLFILILGSAIVSIGIVLLFHLLNQITIPLSKLTYAARKIADGDFSESIIIEAKDELGSLSKNIESMRISLRSTLEGLSEEIAERKQIENELLLARQQLEEQVRERTTQLERTNEELNSEIHEHKQDQERINRLNEDMGLRIMERTSELQLANKELHEANAMNQALLQAVPFPMGIVDEQGTLLSLSPRLEALVGKEAIGEKCWLFYKDNKEQCLDCPLKKGISLGQTGVIETNGAFGGKIFSISHTGILFQGKKAVLEVYQDVSERRRQEEELRNAYEKLKTMQAQLVQSAKMASLGQLAGGVAHEINNPLTGVLNNIQLIKMELEAKKALNFNDFRNTLDVIEESALRCAAIIRSLLDFSHPAEEAFLPLSLNDIAEKIIALIGLEMKLHNIAIEKQFEDGLPLVLGDSQLLQQAIFDIVSNAQWAIRGKSDQGGLITIKTEYEPQMSIVSLSVSDTGIGISKENLEKLFEPFFTTKSIGEGTGLGLAIVYSIVKKHSGNIEAASELGQGATFKISLPVGRPAVK